LADDILQGNAQTPEVPASYQKAAQQTLTETQFQPVGTKAMEQPTPGATGETPSATTPEKAFTQADIDRILKDRLAQQAKQFSDYDSLKAKVQKMEDAAKSESDKLADRLKQLESENQQLAAARRELTIRTAISDAASAAGLPAEAAYRLVEQSRVDVNDAGVVTNAADLVKAVAEAYPGLIRQATPRVAATNPARSVEVGTRTDAERFQTYFQGGSGGFWSGSGVRMPEEKQ